MKPNLAGHVESKQLQQKEAHNATATPRTFTVGQRCISGILVRVNVGFQGRL